MSTASSGNKVKVLFTGRVESVEAAVLLHAKIQALHASKAGPFHVAFGSCSTATAIIDQWRHAVWPIPFYLQDTTAASAAAAVPNNNSSKVDSGDTKDGGGAGEEAASGPTNDTRNDGEESSPCFELAPNLYILRDKNNDSNTDPVAGIWRIPVSTGQTHASELVVASLPPQFRGDQAAANQKQLQDTLQHVSYTGCDVLLSTEWPQGMETLLSATTTTKTNVSFDVADIALKARARYHVAFAAQTFQQSPAFQHVRATTSTMAVHHTGRFLALCPVSTDTKVEKSQKCIHAVGVVPLHSQGATDAAAAADVAKAVPCPYTDAVYPMDDPRRSTNNNNNTDNSQAARAGGAVGLSEAAARRILAEDRRRTGMMSGTDRWATNKRPRQQTHEEQAVDPENCTLFVYGLHLDVTGRLQSGQGDVVLLQAFAVYGAAKVRKPPGAGGGNTASFCFLEFPTHEKAAACLEATAGEITVAGVHLTIKWATTGPSNKTTADSYKRQRLTENEARDSSTVYFKFTVAKESTSQLPSLTEAGEVLRKWMEHTLELALAGEDCKEEDIVRAADEPALQVQVRLPTDVEQKTFGFLDFASHAAASMALATLTGSTDGGRVLDEQQAMYSKKNDAVDLTESVIGPLVGIYLHWAQARVEAGGDRREQDVIEDGTAGFRFERKHFPADARKDCWFCLASASCEKHLITGVYDTCYAAMPKGPVHPGHVLLVPVQHSSQGALKDPVVAREMEELKTKLRLHASTAYDADLFVFERAMQTKGGYHTHVQCIPVERKLGLKLQTTMLAQARKLGIELREINSDVGLQAVLTSDENDADNEGGYFYAEIPVIGTEYKRFLYKATIGSSRVMSVPLQFGREVLAAVLGEPKLAHWKSCVVDQEQETAIAAAFRESFANVNAADGS